MLSLLLFLFMDIHKHKSFPVRSLQTYQKAKRNTQSRSFNQCEVSHLGHGHSRAMIQSVFRLTLSLILSDRTGKGMRLLTSDGCISPLAVTSVWWVSLKARPTDVIVTSSHTSTNNQISNLMEDLRFETLYWRRYCFDLVNYSRIRS